MLRILLIEDNPADVHLVRVALQEAGVTARLEVINDGALASERIALAARMPHPDLILLDINLPRKSGLELLSEIRACECFANTPVIVVSSTSRVAEIEAVSEPGMARFFQKPVTLVDFLVLGTVIRDAVKTPERSALGAAPNGLH